MDLLEQCELDDEKLMGKSSRHRGPKVGEGEREARKTQKPRERRETNDHMPPRTPEKVQRTVLDREKEEEGQDRTCSHMTGAHDRRKHIGCDFGEKRIGEKVKNWKEKTRPPRGQLSGCLSCSVWTIFLSIPFAFRLSVTCTCTAPQFPTTAHCSSHHLASLPSLHLSMSFSLPAHLHPFLTRGLNELEHSVLGA